MLVSVIIPAYNAEAYLAEAVESVVRERETADIEAVIVEDGSTDGTLALCGRLRERHPDCVRVLRHPGGANRGIGASRNLGIAGARGELLAFLDADDFWLPARLDVSLEILRDRPDIDGVYEPVSVFFEDSASEADRYFHPEVFCPPPDTRPGELLKNVLFGRAWHVAGILLRKTALSRSGLFPETRAMAEDTHLWLRLAATCRLVGGKTDRPVARYRRHAANNWMPTTHPDKFPFYWDLCQWFARNLVDPEANGLVRDRTLNSVARSPVGGDMRETALMAVRAAQMARAYPGVLGRKSFYRLLRRVLTLYPLRRRLRLHRAQQRAAGSVACQADKRRVFLVGCPRSGTTLLQAMLAAHPEVVSFPETHFIPALVGLAGYRQFGELPQGVRAWCRFLRRELYRRVGRARRAGRKRLEQFLTETGKGDMLASLGPCAGTMKGAVREYLGVLDALAAERGRRIWVEKTPHNIHYIDVIERYVPGASFVHIVREGTDNVASLYDAAQKYDRPWGREHRRDEDLRICWVQT